MAEFMDRRQAGIDQTRSPSNGFRKMTTRRLEKPETCRTGDGSDAPVTHRASPILSSTFKEPP
jgi:hypothetical protein